MSVRDILEKLRWSVNKADSFLLTPDLRIRMLHDTHNEHGSPSGLFLLLTFRGRDQVRVLGKEHIETRGKSQWFRDNTWRLSPAGIEFFAPGLEGVVARIEAGQ